MKRLHNDLTKGLGKDTHEKSIVKCWITYIQDLPNGKGTLPSRDIQLLLKIFFELVRKLTVASIYYFRTRQISGFRFGWH